MVNHHLNHKSLFLPLVYISYPVSFFFWGFNPYLCPHSQDPGFSVSDVIILCSEYWLKPTFTWAWGRWRKELTGLMRGLLLMALIEKARVECRNAWVIMITVCSYLACSPIFMAHMDFLQSSQSKPGWQVYTHTHYKPALAHNKSQIKTQEPTETKLDHSNTDSHS